MKPRQPFVQFYNCYKKVPIPAELFWKMRETVNELYVLCPKRPLTSNTKPSPSGRGFFIS